MFEYKKRYGIAPNNLQKKNKWNGNLKTVSSRGQGFCIRVYKKEFLVPYAWQYYLHVHVGSMGSLKTVLYKKQQFTRMMQ